MILTASRRVVTMPADSSAQPPQTERGDTRKDTESMGSDMTIQSNASPPTLANGPHNEEGDSLEPWDVWIRRAGRTVEARL